MHRSFVAAFTALRPSIKQAWEQKLRLEPITSPLANPDTLCLMMDRTLDEITVHLNRRFQGERPADQPRPGCICGLNPHLAYFRVAASVFPIVMSEAAPRCPNLNAFDFARCIKELVAAVQTHAREQVGVFCAMCQTEIARGIRAASTVPSVTAVIAGN